MVDEEDIQEVLKDILRTGDPPCPEKLTEEQWELFLEDIWVELESSDDTSTHGEQSVGIPDQSSRLERYTFSSWVSLDGEDSILDVKGWIDISISEHIGRDADDTYDTDWEVYEYSYEYSYE